MSLHAKGLIVSWALNNRGVVVDDWKTRAVEREDKWKDLSRYTIDGESGGLKEWDVAVKEREARESYWNYANYAPDVGKIRGYIPAVPGMRGVSGASEGGFVGGDSDGKGFDEAVAKTAEDGVGKRQESAQATSFWSRYMPSSVAGAPKPQSATEQSKQSEESKGSNDSATKAEAEAAPSFTSYLWSADTGISSPSSDDKVKAQADAAASQSWLSYGYSYIPNVRGRSQSRPSTPAPKSQSASEPEAKAKLDDAQKLETEPEEAQPKQEASKEADSSIPTTSEEEKKKNTN